MKETFIDILLERSRLDDPSHPKYRNKHILIIDSLHDGQAHCSCKGWFYSQTGEVNYQEVFEQFDKHWKSVPKNGDSDANCVTLEE